MDVLPQGRHFLQVVHHSFMFCGGRCAIIGGLKYNGSCAGVTLFAHQLGAASRFSGQFPYKANGHGRAMLAPTRVFRQSAPRVPILEPSAFFISCFLIARSTVSRALLQCTDHIHCFSTSFSFLIKLVKKPGTKVTNLRKLGIPADKAYQWANSRLGYWRIAGSPDLKCSITNERLAAAGYFSILNYYESLHLCC